jgi:hypothetical protein
MVAERPWIGLFYCAGFMAGLGLSAKHRVLSHKRVRMSLRI